MVLERLILHVGRTFWGTVTWGVASVRLDKIHGGWVVGKSKKYGLQTCETNSLMELGGGRGNGWEKIEGPFSSNLKIGTTKYSGKNP